MKHEIMQMDKAILTLNEIDTSLLESHMLKEDQVECPVIHRFGPGTYIREVHIPANTLAIGHSQNFKHTNIMLKGRVTMLNDDGSTTQYKAPMIFTGKPGRKIGFIHEDMVWLNVYPNTEGEQDIEKLENKWMTKSEEFKLSNEGKNALMIGSKLDDHEDFEQAIHELGFSADEVRKVSESETDMINLPDGAFMFKVAPSYIEGKGIFATADFAIGDMIGPARIDGKRTILGRYTNHSKNPNARFVIGDEKNIYLTAISKILGCRGGFNGDEITVDYREAVKLNKSIEVKLCQE